VKEIIKLILKYHFTIIFVLLEALSFSLIVLHNNYQRTVFSRYTASFFGSIGSAVAKVDDYFALRETNRKLVAENTDLNNTLERLRRYERLYRKDSLNRLIQATDVNYTYQAAEMIRADFNRTKNYMTIDKGSEDGLYPEMAVCTGENVVGVIQHVSKHYATVLPLINTNFRLSAKVKKNGYYGSLQWDGDDYRYSYLNDIPFHVDVVPGDTIVTSGFSYIFPEGKLIGFVESVDKETANFLSVKVKLATDFKKISDVYIIANTKRQEQQELEGMNNE